MVIKVGVNGFGRIGRVVFRACFMNTNLEISAINDPAIDIEYICYLIKFDSTHGKFNATIAHKKDEISVDDVTIKVFHEKVPNHIPWQTAGVHYVIEASGMFTTLEKASGHLASAGVKRVILTAPSVDIPMIIIGVNEEKLQQGQKVVSCASSTLYCLAPIVKVLDDSFGVAEGFVTSIHAMTPSLKPLDALCLRGKHWRDHRSIHQNIIPATTGACRALGRIIPRVRDKLAGLAFRVPIVNVSVLDLTVRLSSNTKLEEIIDKVDKASKSHMVNIIKTSNEKVVSSDFKEETHSCILDNESSLQLKSNFFKLICWYENEYSYACRVIDLIMLSEKQLTIGPKCENSKDFPQANDQRVEIDDPKLILFSDSQKSSLKSKPQILPLKKQISSQIANANFTTINSKELKRRNEGFKMWNNDKVTTKTDVRHNRSSFFHSCTAMAPPTTDLMECVKAQERLEMLKKEFSKMVNFTESLLKKSNVKLEDTTLSEASDRMLYRSSDFKNSFETLSENYNYCIKDEANRGGDFISTIISNDKRETPKTSGKEIRNREAQNKLIILQVDQKKQQTANNFKPSCATSTTKLKQDNMDIQSDLSENANIQNNRRNDLSIEKKYNNELDTSRSKDEVKSDMFFVKNDEDAVCKDFTKVGKKYFDACYNSQISNKSVQKIIDSDPNFTFGDIENSNETKVLNDFEDDIAVIETKASKHTEEKPVTVIKEKLEEIFTESEQTPKFDSSVSASAKGSNIEVVKYKEDIYDKLDSASATDSSNSFQVNEKKSQILNISDLACSSSEDLARLDKICKIIEISDELSNKLFSTLNDGERLSARQQKWSFKELCERIKLDEFCEKLFGK